MKKTVLFIMLAVFSVGFISCDGDNEDLFDSTTNPPTTQNPAPQPEKKPVKVKKVKTILPAKSFNLNGTLSLGGISNKGVQIDLPSNTLYWYFSYTFTQNVLSSTISLRSKVEENLKNPSIPITTNTGSTTGNIYLIMGSDNYNLFLDENTFYYLVDYSKKKTTEGVFKVTGKSDENLYIGLSNSNSFDGIYASLQIVAVVEEIEYQ